MQKLQFTPRPNGRLEVSQAILNAGTKYALLRPITIKIAARDGSPLAGSENGILDLDTPAVAERLRMRPIGYLLPVAAVLTSEFGEKWVASIDLRKANA